MGVDIATPEAGSTTGGLTRDATLQHGQRFVLVERESGKILMAIGENALLQACDDMSALPNMWHRHWDCVIEEGWVTLRNRVTQNYLGAAGFRWLSIAPRDRNFTGYLVVTRSSGGGQTLSAVYQEPLGIKQIVCDGNFNGERLRLDPGATKGLEWEFIMLDS
ncbi:hypothetical protein E4U15_004558 [Claviceps sp. LM218 group G6]|nr:hypothetical protein E4U15_004558 [Claviceps sp. LM218 group G6]